MNQVSAKDSFVAEAPVADSEVPAEALAGPDERAIIQLDAAHLESHGIVGLNRKDQRARPYNLMRTQLVKRMSEANHRLVGITSAVPGAGKSFTAVNLALSLAKLGKFPVTLVDLDFRRGALARYLGITPKVGVAEALDGEAAAADVALRVALPNLTLYPALNGDESGSGLLASKAFDDFIAHVTAEVGDGLALFDLPPVFADDDAMIATQKLDGYLLLADAGVTPAKHITDSVERLKPASCLGTILNRYEGGVFDSYRYGYGYGYGSYTAA